MENEKPFPKTLQEAILYFSDADNCQRFMVAMRWPDGVVHCPTCNSEKVTYLAKARVWKCYGKHDRPKFSIKIGTVMEDSPIGLDKWLAAIWLIANAKNGVSSYEIHRSLGVTQKTAWFLLHRIRLAMQTGTFKKLSGTVECDETAIGGLAKNMHKHKRAAKVTKTGFASGKMLVMGLLERHGEVVTRVISDTDGKTLQRAIRNEVERGSEIFTDGYGGYKGISTDYVHEFVQHNEEYVRGRIHTNGIENFWSLLKRSVKGTYVAIDPQHLFRYLDEQSFRYNQRKVKDADRFVQVATMVTGRRLTYDELIGKNGCDEESNPETNS